MTEYTSLQLRDMTIQWLLEEHPDAHVLKEFSLAQWGNSLIDVAAISKNEIIGVEIKGIGDSPSRLKLQGAMYSQVCSRVFLLATPKLEGVIKRNNHKPERWDFLTVRDGKIARPIGYPKERKPEYLPINSAGQMLGILWKDELIKTARSLHIEANQKESKGIIAWRIAETVPLGTVRPAVITRLRLRDWGDKPIFKNDIAA